MTKVAATDVIDGLVVDHEATVGVLEGGVSGENGVVWLDNRGSDLEELGRHRTPACTSCRSRPTNAP